MISCCVQFYQPSMDHSLIAIQEHGFGDELVECTETLDCPVYVCFDEECPQMECLDNKCLLFIPCGDQKCDQNELCCCGACSPQGTVCDECDQCGSTYCPSGQVCCKLIFCNGHSSLLWVPNPVDSLSKATRVARYAQLLVDSVPRRCA